MPGRPRSATRPAESSPELEDPRSQGRRAVAASERQRARVAPDLRARFLEEPLGRATVERRQQRGRAACGRRAARTPGGAGPPPERGSAGSRRCARGRSRDARPALGSSNSASLMTASSACGRSKLMCAFIPSRRWRIGGTRGPDPASAKATCHGPGADPSSFHRSNASRYSSAKARSQRSVHAGSTNPPRVGCASSSRTAAVVRV